MVFLRSSFRSSCLRFILARNYKGFAVDMDSLYQANLHFSWGITMVFFRSSFRSNCLRFILARNYSPNSCLQHGVLAVNLLIHQGGPAFPSSEEPHFYHTSAVPFKFSKQHFSESWCGCRETQNNVVRHPCSDPWVAHFCHTSLLIFTFSKCAICLRPLLSSKSFKFDHNYKHSWTAWFLSWSVDIYFSSNT